MKIYGDRLSGNCYKISLVCALLSIDHEWIDVDILKGDTQTQGFLAKNPLGKIPLLELDNGECLTESNAIINYLARESSYVPKDAMQLAKCQSWQFFEQYSHEPYIAVARFIVKYLGSPESKQQELIDKKEGGYKALAIMEQQLKQTHYLTGDEVTVADISLFAYTHVAEDGGFSLTKYPAIKQWLARIENTTGFVAMN